MSWFRKVKIDNNTSAFGEIMTAHKTPIVQLENKYKIDPAELDELEIYENSSGSADNNGNKFRCQTGTQAGGYGVIRSKDSINYHAGQGVECQITATFTTGIATSTQFAGMFSLTETLAFGYDGADFSVIHEYGGEAEVQKLTVTVSGTGTTTITLDSDAVGITTAAGDSLATTAEKLRAGLAGDATLSGKWRFEQIDDMVFCISKSVGNKTGTMSVTGASTVSIAEDTQGVSKTTNNTAKASWSETSTPFTGYDPTQINLYKIQFGYLGAANINFFVYSPDLGDWVLVHIEKWANTSDDLNLGDPNLKVGWTSASLGSSGTNLTVQGGSCSLMMEGDEVIKNDVHAERFIDTGVTATSSNLITLKNRIVYGGEFNLSKVLPVRVSVDNEHNKGTIIEIYKNPTVGGTPNFQYHDEFNSVAAYDTSGTTITGGEFIDGFTVATNAAEVVDLTILSTELLPEDTLVFSARTVSGSATNVTIIVTWKEEK